MSAPVLRRSALYLPAANARAIEKSRGLDCDVVILDLEDAVAPEMKEQARAQAVAAIRTGGFGSRSLVVRVNGLSTSWGEADLAALATADHSALHAVLVPKVDDADALHAYSGFLAPHGIRLWAMIETTRAIFRLEQIADAAAATGLDCLVIGTNDLAKEMRTRLDVRRLPLMGMLGLTVAAARLAGIGVLDGVFNAIDDPAGFAEQCTQGADIGFDGKTLIHPSQIAGCNLAFSPDAARIAWARGVVAAFALPENARLGALRVGTEMVERLHLVEAERILAIGAATGEPVRNP